MQLSWFPGVSSRHGRQTPVLVPASKEEIETASCPQARGEVDLSALAKGRKKKQEAIKHIDKVQNEIDFMNKPVRF